MIIILQTVCNTNSFPEKLSNPLFTDPLCKAKQIDYRLEWSNIIDGVKRKCYKMVTV